MIDTRFGTVVIRATHRYSAAVNGYRISPYLQERLVFAGQSEVYSQGTDLIKLFLGVEMNAMQVHRVTNTYGALSVGLVGASESEVMKKVVKADEVVYVQTDGSMVLTREEAWQEVKVGRIFCQSEVLKLSSTRKEVQQSLYMAHLGSHTDFLKKFEPMVDVFDDLGARLVFITDGASWIRKWQQESYPNALQILDFTHGVEHIAKWLEYAEKDKSKRTQIFNVYKTLLYQKGVSAVIARIAATPSTLKTVLEERRKLVNYLNTNAYRMDYPQYIAQGLSIGSGAIEAAHRTIIQKRMKQSGQRWSQQRVQHMLNIKTANASGQWCKIVNLIRYPKVAA